MSHVEKWKLENCYLFPDYYYYFFSKGKWDSNVLQLCKGFTTIKSWIQNWNSSPAGSRLVFILSFALNEISHALHCNSFNVTNWIFFLLGQNCVYDSWQRIRCCGTSNKTTYSCFTVSVSNPISNNRYWWY